MKKPAAKSRSRVADYFVTLFDAIRGRRPPKPKPRFVEKWHTNPRDVILLDAIREAVQLGVEVTIAERDWHLELRLYDTQRRYARATSIAHDLTEGVSMVETEFYLVWIINEHLSRWRPSRGRKRFDDPQSVPLDYQI
jgi:hypothetical protein